jgi:3-oxoacyl-[acyl-carrier-protein] synthase-1
MFDPVYILADNIITPLGDTTRDNFVQVSLGNTGIKEYTHPQIGKYFASKFPVSEYNFSEYINNSYTPIEQLLINSISKLKIESPVPFNSKEVLFVISSTKGNIDLINNNHFDKERLRLAVLARKISHHFQNPNEPVVISNACISGLQAVQYACYILSQRKYKYAVITGADAVSEFVLSGFHSFQALSPFPCRPFDKSRAGLSLGEGCGSMLLSLDSFGKDFLQIISAASSNDANHLSGPSRTGEGLSAAILQALHLAEVKSNDIDLISSHGTATLYNDEMESLAFQTCNLLDASVFSLKGNIGHTLGAAGIIETIITAECMRNSERVRSLGYFEQGTSVFLQVSKENIKTNIQFALKTASGFGGGNTAIIIKK